jgi:hypothetical protein
MTAVAAAISPADSGAQLVLVIVALTAAVADADPAEAPASVAAVLQQPVLRWMKSSLGNSSNHTLQPS